MNRATASALRQGVVYAGGIVLMKSASLITLPVVTAHLTPDAYGTLEVLVALADVGGVVLGLGLVDTLFRFAGEARDSAQKQRVCANTFGLACVVGLVALLLTQAGAPWIASLLPGDGVTTEQVRWLLLTLVLTSCIQVPLAWLRMNDRATAFFLATVGKTAVQALLVVQAVKAGYGVTGILAANAIADTVLALLLLRWQWRATGLSLRVQSVREQLTYSWPLVISGVALFALGSLDRWWLADAVGNLELGYYALAAKFALITALLVRPFEMWWYPRRFSILSEGDGQARSARIGAIGVTYIVLMACLVAIGGPWLLRWLTPEEYHSAIAYLPWLAAVTALQSVTNLFTVGCYKGRTTLLPMAINLSAGGLAVLGYATLIPPLGVPGAIAATLIAQTARFGMFYHFSQRALPLPYPRVRLTVFCLGAVALCTVMPGVATWTSAVAGAAALGVLLIGAWALRLLPNRFHLARRAPAHAS